LHCPPRKRYCRSFTLAHPQKGGIAKPFLRRSKLISTVLRWHRKDISLQRLFSIFPNGWPGRGLLNLRLVGGTLLIYEGTVALSRSPSLQVMIMEVVAIGAGTLLLIGLGTPVAGAVVVLLEVAFAFSLPAHVEDSILLASLGAALATLGPGLRSIDARLFGRKRIDIGDR
jgi:putative oxidoreductase